MVDRYTRLSFYPTCYPQHEKIKCDQQQQEQLKVQQEQQRVQQVKEVEKRLELEKDEQAKRCSAHNEECRKLRLSPSEVKAARKYFPVAKVIGNNNNSTNSKSTTIDTDRNEKEVANSSHSNAIPEKCLTCALESNEKNQIDKFNHVKDARDITAISLASSSGVAAAVGVFMYVVLSVGVILLALAAIMAGAGAARHFENSHGIDLAFNGIISLMTNKTVIKILVISLIVAAVLLVISLCTLLGVTYKLSNMQKKIGSVILINNIFKYMLEKNKDDLTGCEIDTTALKNIINSNEIANKIDKLISAHNAHILAVDQQLLAKKSITEDGDEFYELHQALITSRAKIIAEEKEKLAKIASDLADTVFKELLDAIPEEKHKNIINQMKDSYIKDRFENDYKQIIETQKKIPLFGGPISSKNVVPLIVDVV